MHIGVTGALGHIGSYLIRQLPDLVGSSDYLLLDNLLTQRYASLFNLPAPRYRFVESDVSSADLRPLFEPLDCVIHLAAITNAAGSFDNAEEVERNNFDATCRVAQACLETGTRLLHLSSTSVYGTQQNVVDESCGDDELVPQSPYAETKLKEERFLGETAANSELQFVVCRFGTICGVSPGMRFHTAVNKFCWQAVMGQPLTVWRTALHQKRPYLTLAEACQAVAHIVNEGLFDNSIYNVLTDNLTVHDIVTLVEKYAGELNIDYVDTEIMNQLSYEVLDARFRSTGFSFRGDIEAAIDETVALLGNANRAD